MAELQIYIPYIPNNITKSILAYYFRNENIGEITNSKMCNKINNGQTYFIGIMNIRLYNTQKAKEFYTKLHLDGGYRFVYDEEAMFYWIVKLYNKNTCLHKNNDDVVPIHKNQVPIDMIPYSNYTMNEFSPINISIKFQDYLYDAIAFENMAREINTTIRNYTYELYGV